MHVHMYSVWASTLVTKRPSAAPDLGVRLLRKVAKVLSNFSFSGNFVPVGQLFFANPQIRLVSFLDLGNCPYGTQEHSSAAARRDRRQWPGVRRYYSGSGCRTGMQDLLLAEFDELENSRAPLNLLILFGLCSLSLSTHGVVGGVIPALQSWLSVRESLCLRHPFCLPHPALRASELAPQVQLPLACPLNPIPLPVGHAHESVAQQLQMPSF